MKLFLVALALFTSSTTVAAEGTIGAANCLVINPNPLPKESVKWTGPCKDGFAHGEGELEWFVNHELDSYYKGTLVRGRKHGHGYRKGAEGDEYEGGFVNGKREGKGTATGPGGDGYEGEWKEGVPHGTGTAVFGLGGRYEGQWSNGRFHGQGKATYAGGQVVTGTFVDGVPQGAQAPQRPESVSKHVLKEDDGKWGRWSGSDTVSGTIPFDKTYHQMSKDEQLLVKRAYQMLYEGDEPPYPARGLKDIFITFQKAGNLWQGTGILHMDVLVDSEGNAESVTVHAALHPDMKKLAAQIVMAEKYKPAVCSGKPCAMAYPFKMKFVKQ